MLYALDVKLLSGLPGKPEAIDLAALVGYVYTIDDDYQKARAWLSLIVGGAMQEGYTAVQPEGESGHWELSRGDVQIRIDLVETDMDMCGSLYAARVMAS